ncbi:MAG TPA: DUF5996 family protein, partial [Micropepsaceae bacterium]|nr:DUF5996 family protein [Micropepsaceae bacterium]
GLTTSPMPYEDRTFEIMFDFLAHRLNILVSDGSVDSFALSPMSVAAFYEEIMSRLRRLGLDCKIWTMPVEIADPIPFEKDQMHASYDAEMVQRFWRNLVIAHHLFTEFRGRFIGKASPVHFFWGSFDLAVTRFSGRPAPPHPGAPNLALRVAREAYSHEVSSCGFWPGNGGYGKAAFYSYAYPQPARFAQAKVSPPTAFFDNMLGEFILLHEDARRAADPRNAVLDFLQTTYEAAAGTPGWDREPPSPKYRVS